MSPDAPVEPLPQTLVADLSRASAHPLDPSAGPGVTHVQTHISHVFLTGERVYKVRKAVDLAFVHFGTRALRNADCLRELVLNRRLAPDVYLGVAPLLPGPRGLEVARAGEALAAPAGREVPEHCVVMRRLPAGRDALSLLQAGRLAPDQLERTAELVARFHAAHGLGRPAPWSRSAWLARIAKPVLDNFEILAGPDLPELDRERLVRAERAARAALSASRERFEARRALGRAVDGHGDLHLQHVWFESDDAPPLLVDCLEFDDDLRRIDAASDVAFLAMDLAYRERRDLAELFLRSYARESDDFDLYRVVDFHVSYRAAVRAKVAALAARDPAIAEPQRAAAAASAARHLRLAEEALAPRKPGALVLLCGSVGTGKSSVAARLADAVDGVVVSSDRTRKRLAGLPPQARAASAEGTGLYTRERTEAVYEALLDRAAPVLGSGRVALLDATYARAERRAHARGFAAERGSPAFLVEVRCAPAVAAARLARREAEGRDPSDAGPALLETSLRGFEPPREWPEERRFVVHTDKEGWQQAVQDIAAALA